MFVLVRTVVYASLFSGLVLIYVPGRLITWRSFASHEGYGTRELAGLFLGSAGALVVIWCIAAFVSVGKGTPAPFDPPRHLVMKGPYRVVRNPMYLGAGGVLAGAALLYHSWGLLAYTLLLLTATHLFVVLYEEPNLRRMFGKEYDAYCATTGRWLPFSK